jgi:hypothetical protein
MRVNKTFSSITSGTPVNALTGTTSAPGDSTRPVYATRVFIQAPHSSTNGIVYVLDSGGPVRVPSSANADDIVAELAAATSTAPGGDYSDVDFRDGGGIDLRTVWIDVATTNTPARISFDLKASAS